MNYENEDAGVTLKVGQVLNITARGEDRPGDDFYRARDALHARRPDAPLPTLPPDESVIMEQPWTFRPNRGGGGGITDHLVICEFSDNKAPATVVSTKFLAVASGQTEVRSLQVDLRTPLPVSTERGACCVPSTANAGFFVPVTVEPR